MENDAKMSSNINILPSYEKLNFEKCTFSFRRHIINHIDNIQEIKKHLLSFSLDGKTGIELMRSFSWKIYLNVLSSDENATLKTWLEETFNMRNEFNKKVKELMNIKKYRGDPLGGFDGGQWGDFFDKADIKHLIKIDVDRTFQDRDLFCENSIKDMEYNILYLFAKVNQPTSYIRYILIIENLKLMSIIMNYLINGLKILQVILMIFIIFSMMKIIFKVIYFI